MEILIILFIFIIGISLGSFYNVVGLRVPKKESIVYPGSHCVKCDYQLKPYDLFPIFSYLFLKGKCRKCGVKISVKYPLMELLTGLLFILLYVASDSTIDFIFQALFMSVMIILTVSDFEYHLVPDKIIFPTFAILIPFGIYVSDETFLSHILGGVIFFGGLLLVAIITKGGMGGGDIKLFGLLGFTMGLVPTFLVFFIACLFGSIVGFLLKISKKGTSVIPFVPYIALGVLLTLIYGDVMWSMIIHR